ncbi:cupin domain-containing protein [Pseudooceanicola algae]|uniref:Cupin type-2 domain-containing protein n=1 Tax=Pseudooceanicola algae TaxID=1537215 RepID=A0A418SJS2_9RHOB|nr:cupin domain-containing protein [Pseudooceanicola algae]QPM90673.1 hypothetical protein PSAL_019120 [Pseudooceanicola algae]
MSQSPTHITDRSTDLLDMPGVPGMQYRLLIDADTVPSANLCHGIFYMAPDSEEAPHTHQVAETIYVLSGCGHVQLGDEELKLETGDMVFIPAGCPHGFHAVDRMEVHFTFPVDRFEDVTYHDAS